MAVANNGMVQWDAYLAALDLRDEESFEACIAACQRNLENPDITPFLRMKNLLAWATAEEYWHKTQTLLREVERLWRERQQSATTGQDFAEQNIIRRGLDELLQRQREELEEDEFEQEEDEFEQEEDEFEAEDDEFEAEEDEFEGDEMETEELDKIEAKEDEEFSREIDPYEHDIREEGEQGEQGESGTVEKTGMSERGEDDENRELKTNSTYWPQALVAPYRSPLPTATRGFITQTIMPMHLRNEHSITDKEEDVEEDSMVVE